MTATTPNYALRYPTGGDRPCDGAQQLNDLRDDIYDVLDGFANTIDQLVPAGDLPMASIAYIGPPILIPADNNFPMPYNTVEQDDIQGADLITFNNGLILGSTPDWYGTYLYGFVTTCDTSLGWKTILTPDPYTQVAAEAIGSTDTEWVEAGASPSFAATALARVTAPTRVQGSTGVGQLTGVPPTFIDLTMRFTRLWAVRLGGI